METFYYKRHLLKDSTKIITVKDSRGNIVGQFNRRFRSKYYQYFSLLINKWELSIEGKDYLFNERICLYDNLRIWGRYRWTINLISDKCNKELQLYDKTKISTNPRFQLIIENQTYRISNEIISH